MCSRYGELRLPASSPFYLLCKQSYYLVKYTIMAGKRGLSIEVSGVTDDVDEQFLTLLLESKKKIGREIDVQDVTLNRIRKTALVTLADDGNFSLISWPSLHVQY